jgi:hypothetical protein
MSQTCGGRPPARQRSLKVAIPPASLFSTEGVMFPGRKVDTDSFPSLEEGTGWPGQFGAMSRQVA